MIITVTLNAALDKTLYVSRLSINGINRVSSTRLDSGGKGINVSKALKAMGGESIAMGILGGETGLYIQHSLSMLDVNSKFCFSNEKTRTNLKVIDTVLHTTTCFNEKGAEVTQEQLDEVYANLIEKVSPGDYVVFAGTNPPGTPDTLLADWTEKLQQIGAIVCLDSTGPAMLKAIQTKPALIKPNKEELEELCGRKLYFDIDVISAAKEMIYAGVQRVAVSLGSDGALFVTADRVFRAYPANVTTLGTDGAGDSMMAALLYCLSNDIHGVDAIRFSMATASAFVTHPGGIVANRDEIDGLMDQIRVDELF